MDKQRFTYLLWRYWWLVILIAVLSTAGTAAWIEKQTPLYSASAVVEVAQAEDRILNVESVKAENPEQADYLTTVTESLTGGHVLIEAAKTAGLHEELRRRGMADLAIVQLLRGKVTARLRAKSRLIDISASDPDPLRAQLLVNAVVKQYLKQEADQRSEGSGSAGTYLDEQASRLSGELKDTKKKIETFRLEHKDIPLEEQSTLISDQTKQITQKQLEVAAMKIKIKEDLKRIVVAKGKPAELLQIASVASVPAISEALKQFRGAKDSFAILKERYLEKHPKHFLASQLVEYTGSTLNSLLAQSSIFLETALVDLKNEETQLSDALTKVESAKQKLAGVLGPYQALKQEAESIQKMYDTVTQRLGEIGLKDSEVIKSPVRLTEEAMTPVAPIWPPRNALLAGAGLSGLLLGLGVLFLVFRLDNRFQSVQQVEFELQRAVLAAIPDDRLEKIDPGNLPAHTAPESLPAEAYRTLRATLALIGEASMSRAILVTSAVPGEGKSRTSANLAIAFAQQGKSTLLIDADLRRPQQQRLFFSEEKMSGKATAPGLAECLSGLADTPSVVRLTQVKNLSIILSGGRSPQPAELLSQANTGKLIAQALVDFDRVVIDTPPVNSVADALALIPHIHYVCLVVRACHTPRKEVQRGLEILDRASANVAGIVFNRIPRKVFGYYYNYKYDPYLSPQDA